jgi:hypothetical protein
MRYTFLPPQPKNSAALEGHYCTGVKKNAENAFSKDKVVDNDSTVKQLHAKIGQLAMENDFLSVALGRIGDSSAKK